MVKVRYELQVEGYVVRNGKVVPFVDEGTYATTNELNAGMESYSEAHNSDPEVAIKHMRVTLKTYEAPRFNLPSTAKVVMNTGSAILESIEFEYLGKLKMLKKGVGEEL